MSIFTFQFRIMIKNLENFLKLQNLMLTEEAFMTELSNTVYDRENSHSKAHALKVLTKTLYEIMNLSTVPT